MITRWFVAMDPETGGFVIPCPKAEPNITSHNRNLAITPLLLYINCHHSQECKKTLDKSSTTSQNNQLSHS